jgi:phenylpyruvate tautomerase PptA (4-oxalocrotonate tautomerase family)
MPNILVKVSEGVFDAAARSALAAAIHASAKAVERWGDSPQQEALTWVLVEEIAAGSFAVGGVDQSSRMIPVIVFFYAPAGVIDQDGRAMAASLIHRAVTRAKSPDDARPVMTSIMISDVPDGTWGANGNIWHLADFANAAGYEHLR